MQNIIFAVLGVVFTVMASYQVMPSVSKYIQSKKADNLIEKEKAIFDAIKRYITIKGVVPADTAALVTEGYIDSNTVSDNGWGTPITLSINASTGVVTLNTDIPNTDGKSAYLQGWRNWIKPTNPSGNVVASTFVVPTDVLGGNAGGILSGAIVSASAPLASASKFWYDTSSGKSVLKMSDGTTWTVATVATTGGGLPTITSANTVTTQTALPTSGNTEGDIRYVYNAGSNTIDTYAYYSTGWSLYGSGGSTTDGTISSVSSVTPIVAYTNTATTFTVTGVKLPSTLAFTLADASCGAITVGSLTSATLSCTIASTGAKTAQVRKTSGGDLLYSATITASLPPYPSSSGAYPSSFLGLLETGQTTSYTANDDGAYKRGLTRDFTNHSDGTITDNRTGLMWQDQTTVNNSTTYTHANAISYCDNLSLAGYTDWVLPNYGQLQSIVNFSTSNPSKFSAFSYVASNIYWSSTTYAPNTANAWIVNFYNGDTANYDKANSYYVRCVRGGQ